MQTHCHNILIMARNNLSASIIEKGFTFDEGILAVMCTPPLKYRYNQLDVSVIDSSNSID